MSSKENNPFYEFDKYNTKSQTTITQIWQQPRQSLSITIPDVPFSPSLLPTEFTPFKRLNKLKKINHNEQHICLKSLRMEKSLNLFM